MRKLIILLILAMVLSCASMAMASSVSYNDGYVTVSTERQGFFEIHIDGRSTNRWVGHLLPTNTFKFELSEGVHTVVLYSPDTGAATNLTLTVGDIHQDDPAPAPTAEPDSQKPDPQTDPAKPDSQDEQKDDNQKEDPEKPVTYPDSPFTFIDASYEGGTINYSFYGLKGYAEIRIDNTSTGRIVRKNGEHSLNWPLEDGLHQMDLYAVSTNELITIYLNAINEVSDADRYGIYVTDSEGSEQPFELVYEEGKLNVAVENTADLQVHLPVQSLSLLLEDGYLAFGIYAGERIDDFDLQELTDALEEQTEETETQLLFALPASAAEELKLYLADENNEVIQEIVLSE